MSAFMLDPKRDSRDLFGDKYSSDGTMHNLKFSNRPQGY